MEQGWIKLHRKLLDNAMMSKSAYLQLWIALLLRANHKQNEFIFNNKKVVLQPGQFITSRDKLSAITGISPSTIEYILEYFESEQQIRQQKTSKFRIISVCNWQIYQSQEEVRQDFRQQADSRLTVGRHHPDTNKNDKNEKTFLGKKDSSSFSQKGATCHQMLDELIAEGVFEDDE